MKLDKLRRKLLKALWIVPLGGLCAVATIQDPSGPCAASNVALEVVRLFNTLELTHKLRLGTYASRADLQNSETMWKFQEWLTRNEGKGESRFIDIYKSLDIESEQILGDWTLSIEKRDRRDAYLLILTSAIDPLTGRGMYLRATKAV